MIERIYLKLSIHFLF